MQKTVNKEEKAFKYSEICHSYYIYSMYLFDN